MKKIFLKERRVALWRLNNNKKQSCCRQRMEIHLTVTMSIAAPITVFLFLYLQVCVCVCACVFLSSSLPLTHWRMLTHQVPWLPSMGWCHFRWHHHAVYVCVFVLCVWVCVQPPSLQPPPHTHTHHLPAALPLLLFSEGRCCLTHTRYTIVQTAVLAQVLAEGRARRIRETDCQEARNTHTHTQKKEAR